MSFTGNKSSGTVHTFGDGKFHQYLLNKTYLWQVSLTKGLVFQRCSGCLFAKWIEVTPPAVLSGLVFSKILETQFWHNIFAEASFELLFFYTLVFLNFVLQDQVSLCSRPTVDSMLISCLGGSFVSAYHFRHYKWIEVTSSVVLSGLFFSKILETQFWHNIFAEASFKLLFFYTLVFLNFVLQDQVSFCTRPTICWFYV